MRRAGNDGRGASNDFRCGAQVESGGRCGRGTAGCGVQVESGASRKCFIRIMRRMKSGAQRAVCTVALTRYRFIALPPHHARLGITPPASC